MPINQDEENREPRGRPKRVLPPRTIYNQPNPYNVQISPELQRQRQIADLGAASGDDGDFVGTNDPRLTDARTPTGPAGGDLNGTFPNPTIDAGLFVPFLQSINAQTGTTYTLDNDDSRKLVTLDNAAPITVTVPTNVSEAIAVGTVIDLAQLGAGQVTVAGAVGVTVNGTPGLKLRAQFSRGSIEKLATNTWLLSGDLAA